MPKQRKRNDEKDASKLNAASGDNQQAQTDSTAESHERAGKISEFESARYTNEMMLLAANRELAAKIATLEKTSEENFASRRAALNLMEDAVLSKEALRISEEKYRTKLEQEVRDRTDELNASRNLLHATMDASMNMVQVFEAVRNEKGEIIDFRYVLLNHEGEKWTPNATGKSLLELQPGVVAEGIFDTFKQVVETGIPNQTERHYVHEQFNGWFFQTVVKLGDGVATTTTDITLRKKTEEDLRLSYDAIKATKMGYWDLDLQVGKSLNRSLRHDQIFGYSEPQRDWSMEIAKRHVVPEDTHIFDEAFNRAFKTGELSFEVRVQWPNGSVHWMAARGQFLIDAKGKPIRGVGINYDVTEQKNADAEILRLKDEIAQRASDKYRALFESIDDGFAIIKLLYDPTGKLHDFVYVENNPAFIRDVKMDLRGKRRSELSLDKKDFLLKKYEYVITTGKPVRFEYDIQSLDDQWFEVTAAPIGEDNYNLIGVIFRNVTERKQREQQQELLLNLSDKLRVAACLKDVQHVVTDLLLEHYDAGWCYYVEWDEEKNIGVVQYDSKRNDLLSVVGTYDVSDLPKSLNLLKSGNILTVPDYENYRFLSPDIQERYRVAGFRSMLIISLVRQGRLISSLIIGDTKVRNWSSYDEALLAEVAERTWAAVEKAKVEETLRHSKERKEFLLKLNYTLSQLSDPIDIQYESARLVAQKLDADRAYFAEVDNEKLIIRKDYVRGEVQSVAGAAESKALVAAINLDNREPVVITDILQSRSHSDEQKAMLAAAKIRSQLSVAISRKDKNVAGFAIDQTTPREWKPVEVSIMQEAAERTWIAVEKAKAEESLQQSEIRLRTLADAVPQLIWSNDARGTANYFNQRWYEYSGLTYEQSFALGWEAIVHPDDAPASKRKWQRAQATGEIFDAEYRLKDKNGKYCWFIGRNVPLKDNAGKIAGWFGSATDIEALKNAQEALRQSEEKLNITLESATDYAIITMDTDRKIDRWSKGASQIFGYTKEEVLGKSADIIFTEEDRLAGVPQLEVDTARTHGRAADERWHQAKNGRRFYASGFMRPIYNENLTGYVKVARDATKQKMFTDELSSQVKERTKQLKSSNDDLQQFAHVASHDLKEPVRKISIFTKIIRDQFVDQLPPEAKGYLERIEVATARMRSMIEGVLRYSKIDNNHEPLEKVDVNAIIRQIEIDLDILISEKKATITKTALPVIFAHSMLIHQLFYNLILNSLKFAKKNEPSQINLSCNRISSKGIKYYEITISDNGIGFQQEYASEIFNTFTRLNSADLYQGSGLGLALCKKIVARYKGKIIASGTPDVGAKFTILFPVGKSEEI